jgi:RNA polymerase sigma factor (sigma-70 family)
MPEKLDDIIKDNEAGLLRYAGRLLGDYESARDIVQDAFLRLLKQNHKKGNVDSIENTRAWLYKTTRNLCYDKFRSAKNRLEITIETSTFDRMTDESSEPDAELEKKEKMQLIKEQINKLNPRSREIVVLKLEHERSYKEIAEIMDISATNVGFILHKAMKELAQGLKGMRLKT